MQGDDHPESVAGNFQQIFLGTRGWLWPAWETDFYPADMPPEWRLAFFNTQFGCLFLPAAMWHTTSAVELAQWVEDTQQSFVFLLEGDDGEVPAALAGRAKILADSSPSIIGFDATSDLKVLGEKIRDKTRQYPALYLISQDGDLAQIERVRILMELMGAHV